MLLAPHSEVLVHRPFDHPFVLPFAHPLAVHHTVSHNCCRFATEEAAGNASLGLWRHVEGQGGAKGVNAPAERHMKGAAFLWKVSAKVTSVRESPRGLLLKCVNF